LTLALDIVRRIETGPAKGYHELGTVKHQINLHDIISIEPSAKMRLICDDPRVPCDSSNICLKAAELMRSRFSIDSAVSIDLVKKIPVQGGLAGGSANAATVIMMLNKIWNLGMDADAMMDIGSAIGRDVPYFFKGGTCFDTETGIIEPINTGMSFHLVLCIPPFGVSTAEAYKNVDYSSIAKQIEKTDAMRSALLSGDIAAVAGNMHNDFESFVFPMYPLLKEIKNRLIEKGCYNAVMSGSGSTVIGLAADKNQAVGIALEMKGMCRDCLCVETLETGKQISA
jgi:4-diphosphocytidyl-2-C-methyl-D-erythritol kinase